MISSVALTAIGDSPDSLIEYVKYIDAEHITGCLGQVKSITEKDKDGGIIKTTNYYYQDTTYPSKVSRIIVLSGDE